MYSKRRYLSRLLFENFFLKVGSFVLAIILWFVVQIQGKIEQKVDLRVESASFQNLPDDGIVRMFKKANDINDLISVRMKGIPSAMSKIAKQASLNIELPSAFNDWGKEVVFELTNKNIQNVPLGVEIIAINPTTISVMLDYYIKKNVEITKEYLGVLPEGFQIKSISLDPETASLSGPRSILESRNSVQSRPVNLGSLEIKYDQTMYTLAETPLITPNFVICEPASVDIIFEIVEILVTKEFKNMDMEIKRLEGTDTIEEYNPEKVTVIVEGPQNIIRSLEPGMLRLILDVQELPADKWRDVIPKVEFPRELTNRVSVKQFIPDKVSVKIVKRNNTH
ncbi:YbbR-like domain-containing protein [bacterium]|nr:YbbR-like domain-containing protein [bacterium]